MKYTTMEGVEIVLPKGISYNQSNAKVVVQLGSVVQNLKVHSYLTYDHLMEHAIRLLKQMTIEQERIPSERFISTSPLPCGRIVPGVRYGTKPSRNGLRIESKFSVRFPVPGKAKTVDKSIYIGSDVEPGSRTYLIKLNAIVKDLERLRAIRREEFRANLPTIVEGDIIDSSGKRKLASNLSDWVTLT